MPDDKKPTKDLASEENNDTIRRFLGDYDDKKPDDKEDKGGGDEDKEDLAGDEDKDEKGGKGAAESFTQEDVDKTVSQAKKEVLDKIKSSFGMTDEEEKELEDKGLIPPWEQEKRTPKTYREIAEFSAELAEHRRKKAEAEADKQKGEVEKQRLDNEKQLNAVWDEQLEDLREAGKLPKIDPSIVAKIKGGKPLDDTEAKDPGLTAQRELFTKMYEVAEARRKVGKPVSTNLKEIFYEHYKAKGKDTPAGEDAPVSGGGAKADEDEGKFEYQDIHKSSFYDIVKS